MAQLANSSGLGRGHSLVRDQLCTDEVALLILDRLSHMFSDWLVVGCCKIALAGTTGHPPHHPSYSSGVALSHGSGKVLVKHSLDRKICRGVLYNWLRLLCCILLTKVSHEVQIQGLRK